MASIEVTRTALTPSNANNAQPLRRFSSKDNLLVLADNAISNGRFSPERPRRSSPTDPPQMAPRQSWLHTPQRRRTLPSKLQLLATAFKVCQDPHEQEVSKLAKRCKMSTHEVQEWFARRRVLEGWVQSQGGKLTADEIACALMRAHGRAELIARKAALPPPATAQEQKTPPLQPDAVEGKQVADPSIKAVVVVA